jgi:hypothetical protein
MKVLTIAEVPAGLSMGIDNKSAGTAEAILLSVTLKKYCQPREFQGFANSSVKPFVKALISEICYPRHHLPWKRDGHESPHQNWRTSCLTHLMLENIQILTIFLYDPGYFCMLPEEAV